MNPRETMPHLFLSVGWFLLIKPEPKQLFNLRPATFLI